MKKFLVPVIILSLIGFFISLVLLFQYHFPNPDIELISCRSETCLTLSQSGYSTFLGIPLASYGIFFYLFMIITSIFATPGEKYNFYMTAVLMFAASVLAVIIDIILAFILIDVNEFCALCLVTYIINVCITILLFFMIISATESTGGITETIKAATGPTGRYFKTQAFKNFCLSVAFLFTIVVAGTCILHIKTDKTRISQEQREKYISYFSSLSRKNLDLFESGMLLGNREAPVSIVVFSDFLCVACSKLYEIEKYLLSRFPGKVKILYYNYPLDKICNKEAPRTLYPNSCLASKIFIAALEHGFFQDLFFYHFLHYKENLPQLKKGDVMISIKGFLQKRGFPEKKTEDFLKTAHSENIEEALRNDIKAGNKLNINAVPTVFLNGRRLRGVPPVEFFTAVVEEEIERAEKK